MSVLAKSRNLQLYFGGQLFSLIGTWMQQMAISWLVYRMTNSPAMLGLFGFASQIPSLVLTPIAGIVADRANRHRLIVITQILAMLQAVVLSVLVCTGQVQLWELVTLSAFLGSVTAFELTARQTFMVDMLDDPEQLTSAIGINSSLNTVTRLIGPFVAGVVVHAAGESCCFILNACSYLAVIVALLFVKTNVRKQPQQHANALEQLKEGVSYAFGSQPIRVLLVLLSAIGFFAMPFAVLMPAFAKDILHGDAQTLGYLTGACSAGSVIAAFLLMAVRDKRQLNSYITWGCAICGLSLMAFGFSYVLPLSLLAVTVTGFGSMLAMVGSNTLIQTIVDEDKRGRVMSFVVMAFLGVGPFGCMAAGSLANVIGINNTVVITGLCTTLVALLFRKQVMAIRPVVKSNVVPITSGIREAEEELALVNA